MYVFKKSAQIKKNNIIFPLMTAFYNFSLKIEISLAKKAVKPILKTEMVPMCMYVCSKT